MKDQPQPEFQFDEWTDTKPVTKGRRAKPTRRSKPKGEAKPAPPPVTIEDHQPMMDGTGPLRRLMDSNFLEYASYVICDRAIPTIEDGLKPVQRRILHSLHERDDGRFMKVANVVGHTMQYHPHGDASIADALVNLTNKKYLIEGQGNFGNVFTGDRAAASRYIECRLTELARNEVFNNALTEFVPSYDGRNKEPVTLPSKLPLLLLLGAEGIAVGLSTRVLPHNFRELIEAQIAILQKKEFHLLPDFPQGGFMDVSEYEDGNGKIKVRARIKTTKNNRLIITELPYGSTTESLTNSIEDAVRKKKVPVRTINDFTAEKVEIELVLSSGTDSNAALKALNAFTNCESSVTGRVVVIHKNRPEDSDVTAILRENTRQLVETLKRELELKKQQLLDALHAKTLVQIFIENRIYKRIEECKTYPDVQKAIVDGLEPFKDQLRREVAPPDIEMLLSVRIRRISLFDINRNRKEIDDILVELDKTEKHLARLVPYAIRYLKELLKKYGSLYPRKTEVSAFKNIEVRELTATELKLNIDKERGYVGSSVDGELFLECSSYDKIILAWYDGRYKVMTPPERTFVDENLAYCAIADRKRVLTVVYTEPESGFTYMKRFMTGGYIMDKEYRCAPEGSQVLVFADDNPAEVYVKYKPAKGQRIHQQVFSPADIAVKGAKAKGNQMTAKAIARISTTKPRWWDENGGGHKGRMI